MKMTTEQLLSHLGIEVGKPFLRDGEKYEVDKCDCLWRYGTVEKTIVGSLDDLLNHEITPLPKYTLTDDEKAIVRNIDDKWKWIHRTNEEIMFIATCSADFNSTYKTWDYDGGHYFNRFPCAEKVFNFIGFGCSVSLDELRKCL